jgi:uncharacterized protein
VVAALILLLFIGRKEELLVRGVLQTATIAGWAPVGASSSRRSCAACCTSTGSPTLERAFVTLAGPFLGSAVHRTGSILGVTFAHGNSNTFRILVRRTWG